jgi:hypothetical protein
MIIGRKLLIRAVCRNRGADKNHLVHTIIGPGRVRHAQAVAHPAGGKLRLTLTIKFQTPPLGEDILVFFRLTILMRNGKPKLRYSLCQLHDT